MILDTSAVIAIIQREPGWQQIRSQLEQATLLRISAGTLQELLVVAHCRGVRSAVEELLLLLDADVVPVDEDLARRASQILQKFGKGQGHGAQLNFGDCFAAALAEREQCPLACVGEDFRAAGFYSVLVMTGPQTMQAIRFNLLFSAVGLLTIALS